MKKLLIVEDDALLRDLLRESFRERGYEVHDFASLRAWRTHDDFVPTHAIFDLKLPGESGLDGLVEIRERHPHCRAIILTGYGSIATAVQAMKLGAVNYVQKPATIEELEAAFEDTLQVEALPLERPRLDRHEREYIEKILQDMDGNISRAARVLGIHRQSLQRKLRKFT